MTRPRKQIVDYFPHQCTHGQTMFIVEQKYGNDGYAFWFKLLELLGSSPGHALDLKRHETWEYMKAKSRLDDEQCNNILDLLARLNAIDQELWMQVRIVWSDNFVNNISDAYRKRADEIAQKPAIRQQKPPEPEQSGAGNPQIKEKKIKVNKIKVNKAAAPLSTDDPDKQIKLRGSKNNVKLSDAEYQALKNQHRETDEAIEYLSLWIAEKGDSSKSASHDATIRRWVISAVKERRARAEKSGVKGKNMGNFEQREYSEDYLHQFYEDVVLPPESEVIKP